MHFHVFVLSLTQNGAVDAHTAGYAGLPKQRSKQWPSAAMILIIIRITFLSVLSVFKRMNLTPDTYPILQ